MAGPNSIQKSFFENVYRKEGCSNCCDFGSIPTFKIGNSPQDFQCQFYGNNRSPQISSL